MAFQSLQQIASNKKLVFHDRKIYGFLNRRNDVKKLSRNEMKESTVFYYKL